MKDEYGSEQIIYKCKENDNTIKLWLEDGNLDEIWVGCKDCASDGFWVIGQKDLSKALGKAGYEIVRASIDKTHEK